MIYAESLSEAALLKALRAGHVYLSAGPHVTFQARDGSGATWISGDTVTQPATLTIGWADCPNDAQVRLLVNGRLLEERLSATQGEWRWALSPDQADWAVVEIRGKDGDLLAITNPIFLHVAQHS